MINGLNLLARYHLRGRYPEFISDLFLCFGGKKL